MRSGVITKSLNREKIRINTKINLSVISAIHPPLLHASP